MVPNLCPFKHLTSLPVLTEPLITSRRRSDRAPRPGRCRVISLTFVFRARLHATKMPRKVKRLHSAAWHSRATRNSRISGRELRQARVARTHTPVITIGFWWEHCCVEKCHASIPSARDRLRGWWMKIGLWVHPSINQLPWFGDWKKVIV